MAQALGQIAGSDVALDAAVAAHAERALAFLERLVAAPSTLGNEAQAQAVLAAELERLGFACERLPVPDAVAAAPEAGVPQRAYAGRHVLVARRAGGPRSLLVNGHVDVVPPGEEALWATPPFQPVRRDGWLYGRGAGDMKAGFAMATLAVEALAAAAPAALDALSLTVVGAIEEECTGNGTLASIAAGVSAEAVLLPEPTDLELLVGGGGVSWFEITVSGSAGHASEADGAAGAIEAAVPVLAALRGFEERLNADADPGTGERPHRINVGTFHAGDWPSSSPAMARLGVRVGHPSSWPHARVEAELRALLAQTVPGRAPALRASGFRAEAHALDPAHPLVRALARAHAAAHGAEPRALVGAATTDARLYQQVAGVPAVCYGPRARNIHGIDEAVQLASIAAGARTLVRFLAAWPGGQEDGRG